MAVWKTPTEEQEKILEKFKLRSGDIAINNLGEDRFVVLCYTNYRQYYYSNSRLMSI